MAISIKIINIKKQYNIMACGCSSVKRNQPVKQVSKRSTPVNRGVQRNTNPTNQKMGRIIRRIISH